MAAFMCPRCWHGKVKGKWPGGIKYTCGTVQQDGQTTTSTQCQRYQKEQA